jgi:hypothetical protein
MSSAMPQLAPASDAEKARAPAGAQGYTLRTSLALAALGAFVVSAWVLLHPYLGIVHDSTLYTLFALTRLHPDNLAGDVFLRFGSQDHYTLFTPIYAAAISLLGLEHAASLLTLVSQAALLTCGWLLARRFMSPLAATLGVGLLAAAPGEYGYSDIFHIMEGFITPRLPAEALVVGALVAALSQRHLIAAGCVVVAMSLHPIIGCAGTAILILTFVAPSRPKLVAIGACIALVGGVVVVLSVSPQGRLLDGDWLYVVRMTSSYLFLKYWGSQDFSRMVVPLAILCIGILNGTTALLRRLCAAALVMVACGLLVTLIFSDLLQVLIFISAQTWRWLWLANTLAFLLAPRIVEDCWRRGTTGRIAVLMLSSAWIFRGTTPTLYLVPLAIACAAVPDRLTTHRNWRLSLLASCVITGLALVLDVTDRLTYFSGIDVSLPMLPQKVRALCADGVVPGALLCAVWLALRREQSMLRVTAVTVAAALTCGTALYFAWQGSNAHYTAELATKFTQWRAVIPPRAEMLWPDTPVGSWYLLERPNYWSPHQTAGAIFSKEKAVFLQRRSESIAKAAAKSPPGQDGHAAIESVGVFAITSRLDLLGMKMACSDPDLSYIVSWKPVAPTPYAPVTVDGRKLRGKLYLYRCADLLH